MRSDKPSVSLAPFGTKISNPPELLNSITYLWLFNISRVQHNSIVCHIFVSALALLVYDFFQTLAEEIECIWKPPFTSLKLIYVFMKYLPFFDVPLRIILNQARMRAEVCHAINATAGWSFYIGLAATQLILSLRTWILWGQPRWLSCALVLMNGFIYTYGSIHFNSALNAIHFINVEGQRPFQSGPCVGVPDPQAPSTLLNWMLQLIYDGVLCLILVVRVILESRKGRITRPVYAIYRDGITYYIYILSLNLVLLFWIVGRHQEFLLPLSTLMRVVHPLLTARVVLHTRQQRYHSSTQHVSNVISTIYV